jgi:hypothetical protein
MHPSYDLIDAEMHPEARRPLVQSQKALAGGGRLKDRRNGLKEPTRPVWSHLARRVALTGVRAQG